MQRTLSIWMLMVLLGCGSTNVSIVSPGPLDLLESQDIFEIRFNACGCIVDTPELDFEVKLGRRWTRVFLEADETTQNALVNFRSAFLRNPRTTMKIEGEFTGVFYRWMQGRRAPGIEFKRWLHQASDEKIGDAFAK